LCSEFAIYRYAINYIKEIFEKRGITLLGNNKFKKSTPRRFKDHPMKTVGGVVITRIC